MDKLLYELLYFGQKILIMADYPPPLDGPPHPPPPGIELINYIGTFIGIGLFIFLIIFHWKNR